MKQFLAIIAMCVAAAVTYGIIHDQVTVRICLEYFTVLHPHIIDSTNPTIIALVWGVVATWWVGLPLGVLVAVASRLGKSNRLEPRQLVIPLLVLLGVVGLCAVAGAMVAPSVAPPWEQTEMRVEITPEQYPAIVVCAGAHTASYASGVLGGLGLVAWVIVTRRRQSRASASQ